MANTNRYWIANYSATPNFTLAANWADNADGTGANTAPTAGDMLHFGHPTTLAAGLGYGSCTVNSASPNIAQLTTYSGYNKVEMTGKFAITAVSRQFAVSPVGALDPSQAGFKVGMVVTVTGCADAANNDTYQIATLSAGLMTMTTAAGGSSMANEVAGNDVTITYDPAIDMNGQVLNMNDVIGGVGTVMILNSKLKNSTGTGSITFQGVQVGGGGGLYYKCGEKATIENRDTITMSFTPTGTMNFDNGIYPIVQLNAGTYTCDYTTPTSTVHESANFFKFKEAVATTWTNGGTKRQNIKKIFKVENATSFVLLTLAFNTGQSTWIFDINDANLKIPVTGDYINYPSGFVARWYNLSFINSGTNTTRKAILPARRNLDVNSISVGVGANLEGEKVESTTGTAHKGASSITSNTRPTINGSWNFIQIADGVYSSLLHESFINSPSHGTRGHIQFSYDGGAFHSHSKMLVVLDNWVNDWTTANAYIYLTDGTYISSGKYQFNQNYAVGAGGGVNSIWISNGTPSVPYFTDSAGTEHSLLGGGGGGGGMTSWTLSGDSGANQTITDGNTVDIAGGTGISSVASATDTVTITNTGVTSNVAGTGITVSGATGAVTIGCDLEGTELKSTGETGGTKFLREDGDGTCSWQTVSGGGGITGITVRDEGVALSTLATSLDFVGAGVVASGTGVAKTITIAGGGGGGQPLFKHDQNPTSSNFNPHRLLVHGDTIEVGLATGSGKNVDVFTPAITSDGANRMITINATGASATNTGREYIFFGQFGDRSTGDPVVYQFDNSGGSLTVPHFFIHHMSQVVLPATAPNFSFIVTHQLRIVPMTAVDSGFTPPNAVRVVDAGQWSLLNPSLDEENPIPHRLFLVTDIPYDFQARVITAFLGKNFTP